LISPNKQEAKLTLDSRRRRPIVLPYSNFGGHVTSSVTWSLFR